jgi:hypothetical protein
MYTYPQLQPAGQLTGIPDPEGLCVNRRTGDVWVVSGFPTAQFTEFRHGGTKPIHKIKFGNADFTQSCSVDSNTGDLAVTSNLAHGLRGAVIVFGAKAKTYRDVLIENYEFVSYDESDDLFVDGPGVRTPAAIGELKPGKTRFHNFPLEGTGTFHPGGLQYSKGSLVVGATKHHVIYQTSNGVVTGSTALLGACRIEQFEIDEIVVIVPSSCGSDGAVLIYNYPGGGMPIARIPHVNRPFAVTISNPYDGARNQPDANCNRRYASAGFHAREVSGGIRASSTRPDSRWWPGPPFEQGNRAGARDFIGATRADFLVVFVATL